MQTGKLQLEGWEKYTHFEPAFALFFISAIFIIICLYFWLQGTSKITFLEGFLFTVFWVTIGIFVLFVQNARLKFESIKTNLTEKQLRKIVDSVGNELDWIKIQETENLIIAKTYPSFSSGSWGEQITIIDLLRN